MHEYTCPDCLEDRIQMGDAVVAAIPYTDLDKDRKGGVFIGAGFAERHKGIGLAAAIRLGDAVMLSGGVATNLDEVCGDPEERCFKHYDQFDYWSGRIQLGWQF